MISILFLYWYESLSLVVCQALNQTREISRIQIAFNLAICLLSSAFFNNQTYYLTALRIFEVFPTLARLEVFYFVQQLIKIYQMSLKQIISLVCLIIYFFLIFGIIGLNLWANKMDTRCSVFQNGHWQPVQSITTLCTKQEIYGFKCPTGTYCRSTSHLDIIELNYGLSNFDHLGQAFLTLFQVFFIEGWGVIMYMLRDATNYFVPPLYFTIFFMVCTYFLSNLIVAIFLKQMTLMNEPILTHSKVQVKTTKKVVTATITRKRSLYHKKSLQHSSNESIKSLREFCVKISRNFFFVFLINTLILILMIFLSTNSYYGPSESVLETFMIFQFIFVCVFLFEDGIRIISWDDNLIMGAIELIIDIVSIVFLLTERRLAVITAVKGLRLIWLFEKTVLLSNIILSVKKSFHQILNLLFVFAIYLIVSVIIARWLFEGQLCDKLSQMYPRSNFDDILIGSTTILQIIIGDNWNYVWYDCQACTSTWKTHIFFICLVFFGRMVLTNSFLTLILANFKEAQKIVDQSLLKQKTKKLEQKTEQMGSLDISRYSVNQIVPLNVKQTRQPVLKEIENFIRNSSFCIFHHKDRVRTMCQNLMQSQAFERSILSKWLLFYFKKVIVLVSSILVALDDPFLDPKGTYKEVLYFTDIVMAALLVIECFIKSIALGFAYNAKGNNQAYIRNLWNLLDFIIVVSQVTYLFNYQKQFRMLKAIRVLRALKSLKLLSKNEELRLLINAFFQTLPLLGSIIVVMGMMIWVMALLCMDLYKGTFYYCTVQANSKTDCRGDWVNYVSNFDNLWNSIVNVLKTIVGDNWVLTMFIAADHMGIDQQPLRDHNRNHFLLFQILLFLNHIIFLNLFVGLVINNFWKIKEQSSGSSLLSPNERKLIEMQRIMLKKQPIVIVPQPDDSSLRLFCYNLTSKIAFEITTYILILINLVILSVKYKGLNESSFYYVNLAFLILFHIETIIKLLALGVKTHFKKGWNIFDFFILLLSDISLVAETYFYTSSLSIATLQLRALKLGQLVKYVPSFFFYSKLKSDSSLRIIIDSIYYLMPSLLNIVFLAFILIYIYAIIGMYLFAFIKMPSIENYPLYLQEVRFSDENFQNFNQSVVLLLQLFTGQKWDRVMFELSSSVQGCVFYQTFDDFSQKGPNECGTWLAYPFFITYLLFMRIIIVNLFLAIVIEGFFEILLENEAIINKSQLFEFLIKWSDYDPEGTGFITFEDLIFLLFELPPPLGFKVDNIKYNFNQSCHFFLQILEHIKTSQYIFHPIKKFMLIKKQIFKNLSHFNIPIYNQNQVHFKDVCIQLSHQVACSQMNLKSLEIQSHYAKQLIDSQWENKYPDLESKLLKRNDKLIGSMELFAMHCLSSIFKDLIQKRRLKLIYKEELIATKLKDQLINMPARKKIYSQKQPQIQGNSKKASFTKHQENFISNQTSNQLQRGRSIQVDQQMLSHAQQQQRVNRKHATYIRSSSLSSLSLPKNWHNFHLGGVEELEEGWPTNVIVVKNQIDSDPYLPTLGNQNTSNEKNLQFAENDLIYLHQDLMQTNKDDFKLQTNGQVSIMELDENSDHSSEVMQQKKKNFRRSNKVCHIFQQFLREFSLKLDKKEVALPSLIKEDQNNEKRMTYIDNTREVILIELNCFLYQKWFFI